MTIETITLARPYAKAAFEFAQQAKRLSQWRLLLQAATLVSADPVVKSFYNHPKVSHQSLFELFSDVCQAYSDDAGNNFLHLLAANNRLALLPEITTLFEELLAQHDKTIVVSITSYDQLSEQQQTTIKTALQKRLDRSIKLECHQDVELLGGAIVRCGDLVIDGSARHRLQSLYKELVG